MNKRKSILSTYIKKQSQENQISDILSMLYQYYKIYDIDKHTVYSQVFYMLYLDRRHYTYNKIAEKTHIALSTIKRYVKNFEQLAVSLMATCLVEDCQSLKI